MNDLLTFQLHWGSTGLRPVNFKLLIKWYTFHQNLVLWKKYLSKETKYFQNFVILSVETHFYIFWTYSMLTDTADISALHACIIIEQKLVIHIYCISPGILDSICVMFQQETFYCAECLAYQNQKRINDTRLYIDPSIQSFFWISYLYAIPVCICTEKVFRVFTLIYLHICYILNMRIYIRAEIPWWSISWSLFFC